MKVLVALFCLVPCVFALQAPDEWSLVKEQDGIKMYNRPSAHSKFNDIRMEADFTGTLKKMSEILCDVDKYTEWAYSTKTSTLVKRVSPTEFIYYSEFDAPWPVDNRDYYAYFKIFFDSAAQAFKVVSANIKNYMPEKKNIVRVPLSNAIWNITAINQRKLHVEYVLELDPGGNVPTWLLNLISVTAPMQTFENLKKRLSD